MARVLSEVVRAAGFTPSVRDVPALVALLARDDDALVKDVERALGRLEARGVTALVAALEASRPPVRGRVCRALGRIEGPEALAALVGSLEDEDAKTRRNAAIALGRRIDARVTPRGGAGGLDVEGALLEAFARETREDQRRSLAEALGKLGGARAAERLGAFSPAAHAERGHGPRNAARLDEVVAQARHRIERTAERAEESTIPHDAVSAAPLAVVLTCRTGLESLLASELRAALPASRPRAGTPGTVTATLEAQPLGAIFAARTFLDLRLPLPEVPVAGDEAEAVATALTSARATAIFGSLTRGAWRYRLSFVARGHQRALVWRIARAVLAREPRLRNDPTDSTWEARVAFRGGAAQVTLIPRGLTDSRFAYRQGDVPAASHPTLAAALALVAGARPDDVVWDPFVGSGTELVERARRGPYASLIGTDVEAAALDAARRNLEAAGLAGARLEQADARGYRPEGVRLIVTNPPMGRRVARGTVLGLLDAFVDHATALLPREGRLVWLSPSPARTRERLEARGLTLEHAQAIDLGGFPAELQRAVRRP